MLKDQDRIFKNLYNDMGADVAAAQGYFGYMIFGLVLSVVLTGALATYMANYIQKHIWIAYIGLIFILVVGLQLIIGGLVDLEILNINEEFKKYF
jgi:predicted tellurium resistance membrane protein TerC